MIRLFKAFRLKEQSAIIIIYLFGVLDSAIEVKANINSIIFNLIILFLISILCFLINEFTDKDTDKYRIDKNPSELRCKEFWTMFFILTGTIFFLICFSSIKVILTITYFLAISYSFPKIRFKALFPFDIITLMFVYVVFPYIIPFLLSNHQINYLTLSFLIFFFTSTNIFPVTRDYDSDLRANLKNTGAILGYRNLMKLGIICSIAFILLGFIIQILFNYYWYHFIYIFELLILYFFYKGLKLDYKNKFISTTKKGIITSWLLMLYLIIIIIARSI